MGTLTKEQILGAALKREIVPAPELGGDVIVSEMTAAVRDEWEAVVFDENGIKPGVSMRSELLARCLVDEEGARLFSPSESEALGGLPGSVAGKLRDVAMRINGLSEESKAEIEKN